MVQRAGGILMACGLLAASFGLGGWVVSSRNHRYQATGPVPQVGIPKGRIAQLPSSTGKSAVAAPVRLVIPAIGVSTKLIRLGMTIGHAMQVPSTPYVAGWFTGSARPGAMGPAVIAGHIDSYQGPGIFFRLSQMRPGERAYVIAANRTVAIFRVTAVRTYAKDHFPRAKVYGPSPDSELRLITCGGTFDYTTRQYLSNVVVYAELIT
jgi:sortase (surface protein transpeptidase)